MSKLKALNIIEKTVLPKAKTYSKFRSFEDADHFVNKDDNDTTFANEIITLVDPTLIKIWQFKDRSKTKLDLEDLISRIKDSGQLIPCIVRKIHDDPSYQYELLAGRKRLMAALQLGIQLKVIVKEVKDDIEALIIQNDENEREDPSDYDRGIQYQHLLDTGLMKNQAEIAKIFKKDRQYVSKVLQYAKIPGELESAINDFRKVSANTAEVLVSLASKSPNHLNALLKISDRICEGIGSFAIKKLVDKELQGNPDSKKNFVPRKVFLEGSHFFTWKLDSNNNITVSFTTGSSTSLDQDLIEKLLLDNFKQTIKTKLSFEGQKGEI